ncbi:MAG: hypothetical protein B7Z70_12675 [Acidithiobacillus ferrivorans]|uniref:Uncharacterized protein n=1 Tax=Acidithiobacillus ferrivorans TaxID=160808 RepID=A0A257SNR5_9PROT|nr:MAG: hypothetical protein B7Z70_12675 [Acidithiobacillus ferrivorans]
MRKISAGVILASGSVLGVPVAEADDDFKLSMGGRIQADYAAYVGLEASRRGVCRARILTVSVPNLAMVYHACL